MKGSLSVRNMIPGTSRSQKGDPLHPKGETNTSLSISVRNEHPTYSTIQGRIFLSTLRGFSQLFRSEGKHTRKPTNFDEMADTEASVEPLCLNFLYESDQVVPSTEVIL